MEDPDEENSQKIESKGRKVSTKLSGNSGRIGHLNTHVATVHEGKKAFKCGICTAEFTSKHSMRGHIATVHEGTKAFKCGICNAEFTSKHGMKGHIGTIHEGKKQFKCDICNANFGQKGDMNKHVAADI